MNREIGESPFPDEPRPEEMDGAKWESLTPEQQARVARLQEESPGLSVGEATKLVLAEEVAKKVKE